MNELNLLDRPFRWVCVFGFALTACTPDAPIPLIDLGDLPRTLANPTDEDGVMDLYFTDPGIDPGDEVDPILDDALVALIDASTTRLDLSLYEFNLDAVVDAVLAAGDRGVEVRMVGDGDEIHDPGYEALTEAGIPIVMRNPQDRIMHNKFVVVDEQVVWTGSTNITTNGTFRNNNNALLIESPELAGHFSDEFEQMFTDGLFGRKKTDVNGTHTVAFRGDEISFYFSPEHDPIVTLASLVDQADHSINFMIFALTHPDIEAAFARAQARGVEITGIFDESQGRGQYSIDEALANAGIPVYIDGNHNASGFSGGKLHHKVMIVDAGTDSDPFIVTGSFNWSKSATRYNDENLLVLRDPALTTLFSQEFCGLWEEADLHPSYAGPLPTPCGDPSRKIFINEFLADPEGSDRGNEFVEIVNGSTTTVDLTGWTLGDATNPTRHLFDGTLIGPGDGLAIFDTGDHSDVVNAINSDSGFLSLNNTGDVITLADADGVGVDSVEYGVSRSGVSWNRNPDATLGADWAYHDGLKSNTGASPGTRTDGSPFIPEEVSSDGVVIINELLANPAGTDSGQEFVEVVNVGDEAVNLEGWRLSDLSSDRHIFETLILEPGEGIAIFDKGEHDSPAYITSSSGTLSLNNTGDVISLADPSGELRDSVTYATGTEGISLNRDPDGTAGATLSLHDVVSPTGLASSPGAQADGSSW